jgi:hypothetical protein
MHFDEEHDKARPRCTRVAKKDLQAHIAFMNGIKQGTS